VATTPPNNKKKANTAKNSPTIGQLTRNFLQHIRSEQTQRLLGLACYFLLIALAISFISYLFTWRTDDSYIKDASLWDIFTNATIQTDNWLGRIGSYLSNLFIYRWFGLPAFAMLYLLYITAQKLLRQSTAILGILYRNTFIYMVLSAVTLSWFAFGLDWSFPVGGGIGNTLQAWLYTFGNLPGSALILLFLWFVALTTLSQTIWSWARVTLPFAVLRPISFIKDIVTPAAQHDDEVYEANALEQHKQRRTKQVSNLPARDDADDAKNDEAETAASILVGKQTQLDFEAKQAEAAILNRNKKTAPAERDLSLNINETNRDIISRDIPARIDNSAADDDIPIVERELSAIEVQNDDDDDFMRGREEYDPKLDLSRYKRPPLDLLEEYGRDLYAEDRIAVDREELEKNKNQILETLGNYGIEITKISATPGPTVTLFEVVPAPGIRISRIRSLEDDIALSLSALGIRIIAPMPGKGTIGIEVPNQHKEIVSLRALLGSDKFKNAKMDLPIALGKTISDDDYVADLAKMPHLLLAGATGQGKSVCLNAILVSLLYKKHPAELKFVMIDPKKVELSLFSIIEKHFLAKLPEENEPIVTDTKKVISTLNALCIEMDQRYDLLKRAYVRNIREYNAKFKQRRLSPDKGHRYLPYFVLVIDEFADLIMTAGKEVELPLARLAQLARAIGIHLVIATQRPTVNIITGTIKANFPVRVAFKVTSKIDSRTILDQGGANQLIGRGDMLLSIGGDIIRLQCAFVDTPEVERVAEFIGDQQGYPHAFLLPEYRDDEDSSSSSNAPENMELDDMFEDAARLIVQHQQGSTSLIQRRMKLGYNRAGRLMDQLEKAGIVGGNQGSKPREVLIYDEYELDNYLQKMRQKRGL
jgi:S-DNA-T family DNA segregation ATPase FtsK/SpoIIIE